MLQINLSTCLSLSVLNERNEQGCVHIRARIQESIGINMESGPKDRAMIMFHYHGLLKW